MSNLYTTEQPEDLLGVFENFHQMVETMLSNTPGDVTVETREAIRQLIKTGKNGDKPIPPNTYRCICAADELFRAFLEEYHNENH